jgi:HD-like signal output (HDOD) protein
MFAPDRGNKIFLMTAKKILFVVCDPTERENLYHSLSNLLVDWQKIFTGDRAQALDSAKAGSYDVIVVRASSPIEPEIAFLKEVKRQCPKALQFVLIEPTHRQLLEKRLDTAVHYLPKGCDPARLAAAIERGLQLVRWMENPKIGQLLLKSRELASLPALYHQILDRLRAPEAHITDIAALMSQDPAMCAKMLKVVNSAFFSLSREICDGFEAVMLLGLERTKALVLMTHYLSVFELPKDSRFSIDLFWAHSMATASFAWTIVQSETADTQKADEAFTVGLLHDIGKLTLLTNLTELHCRAEELVTREKLPEWEAEQRVMGVTHDILGACLLGTWGLPLVILEAIAWHHHPLEHPSRRFSLLTAVHVANALAYEQAGCQPAENTSWIDFDYLNAIGLADRYEHWRELCLSPFGLDNGQSKAHTQPLVPHAQGA